MGSARAIAPLAGTVADTITVLGQCQRLHVDRVGVENAIASWPGRDAIRAARTVVMWATDPAFKTTNGAKLLGDALSKQTDGAPKSSRPSRADVWSTESILAAGAAIEAEENAA